MNPPNLAQQPVQHVNPTPDGGYALRILKAYRANCNYRFSGVLDALNEEQEQRAAELDKAIVKLKGL